MRIFHRLFCGLALSLAWPIGAGCSAGNIESTSGVGGAPDISSGDAPPFANDTTSFVSSGTVTPSKNLWVERYGDAEDQIMAAFAANEAGETALVGTARGTVDFGNIPWEGSATDTDVVVAKISGTGQSLWSRRYGDSCDQHGGAVALSPSGNVLLAGDFCGKMDFGTSAVETTGAKVDLFVAVIDALGEDVFSRSFGGQGAQIARAAAVDAKGNAVIVGSFDQAFDDGGGAVVSAGKDDIFVLALDPKGNVLWTELFGGPEADVPRAVAIDAAGNIVLGGSFGGSVDFGGGPLTAASAHPSAFVVQLDPNGKYLWGQTFASDDAVVNGLALGKSGRIAVTGSFAGAIDFGGGLITTAGGDDIFVTALDSAGKVAWGHAYGGAGSERGSALVVGPNDDVALTGTADGALTFGNFGLAATVPEGPNLIYMAHLDGDGIIISGWVVGSSAPLMSVGIAFVSNSEATVAGSLQAPIGTGFQVIPPAGGWDMFLSHRL